MKKVLQKATRTVIFFLHLQENFHRGALQPGLYHFSLELSLNFKREKENERSERKQHDKSETEHLTPNE